LTPEEQAELSQMKLMPNTQGPASESGDSSSSISSISSSSGIEGDDDAGAGGSRVGQKQEVLVSAGPVL